MQHQCNQLVCPPPNNAECSINHSDYFRGLLRRNPYLIHDYSIILRCPECRGCVVDPEVRYEFYFGIPRS